MPYSYFPQGQTEVMMRKLAIGLAVTKSVLLAVSCLALMSVTPALAAPPEIDDFCFYQAQQVWFAGRGEREAFIANCIANLTPPPTKHRKYRKY